MNQTYTEHHSVSIERDLHSDQIISETWRDKHGRFHRGHDLPAVIFFDPATQSPFQFEYFFNGLRSRKDGPAVEIINPESNIVIYEEWRRDGTLYRKDDAAVIHRDGVTGEVTQSEYHVPDDSIYQTPENDSPV